jgi:hypothetical protein
MATLDKKDMSDSKLEYADDLEKTNTTWDDRPTVDPELDRRITRKFDRHGEYVLRFPSMDMLTIFLSGSLAVRSMAAGLHRS